MFRFSSFATKGKSKLFSIRNVFSSTYEAHLKEEQLIHINQNILNVLLWVRVIGTIELCNHAVKILEIFKSK